MPISQANRLPCSSCRRLRPAAQQSYIRLARSLWRTANSDFTTAAQPDAGYASCYGLRCGL